MTSTPTTQPSLSCEVDEQQVAKKCCGMTCVEHSLTIEVGSHADANTPIMRSGNNACFEVDLVLEQIERNRKIVEQLSPVLKYKEIMRKRRSRAAPRRKFSIAQGYPRISRWKASSQPRIIGSGQNYYANLNW
ncbi:hypothetical protein ANCCAN_07521 [Ancylostoma caninum]|uniref:Uncharacterized protein n=1 Tax=Ancylostoma caninum TaxID=29170 RepID=A0A368GPY2_ANCCA|nr:hypothetical protein ANCCAN_07521 [Ancylostoma caninum]